MENALEKINKASLKFLEPLTSDRIYKLITQEGRKIVETEHSSVFLHKNGELERVYATAPFIYKIKPPKGGFLYKSFSTKIPYVLNGEELFATIPQFRNKNIQSSTLIPLSYKNKTIGVVTFLSSKKKQFTSKDLEMLKLFGSMASLAIRKTQLYEEKKKISKEKEAYKIVEAILEKINRAGLNFLTPLSLDLTYKKITAEAVKLLQASFGSLFLVDDGKLIRKAIYPPSSKLEFEPRKRGFTYRSYAEQKTFVINKKNLVLLHPELEGQNYKSAICIPISYHLKSIGSLTLFSQSEHKFSQKELTLLKAFGSYATLAIRKAQLGEDVKRALQTRDLFISIAAHELRTPITTIHGYTQLLQKKLSQTNTQESRWANELSWEVQRLISLVNELLEVNRIKEGQLQYVWKENSLKEIVKKIISNFSFSYPNRKLVFEDKLNSKPDIVVCDFNKMVQAIGNILDNAAKFSPSNTEITVTLKGTNNHASVAVADKGKGIAENDLSKIFERFYKKANSSHEGIGLGLYLTKNIIYMHRGIIKIKSKLHKGTTVQIVLPLLRHHLS